MTRRFRTDAEKTRRTNVTPQGKIILSFIRETVSETGEFPSREMIADCLGWGPFDKNCSSRVHNCLAALAGAGVLTRSVSKNRSSFMLAD